MDRFVVLTGGPGSGKTTLVERVGALGHGVAPEAGRAIRKDEIALGWQLDPVTFLEVVLAWELRSYRAALASDGLVFFDRGMPDVAGGYAQLGLPVPSHVSAAVAMYRYRPMVFVAPPWPDIYTHDEERKHSWESAVRTYEVMVAAYTAAGYSLVSLPLVSVDERLAFVLDHVG